MNECIQILVVDDEPYLLEAASRLLKGAGYKVSEASTGEDGLRLAKEKKPDLVLLDVNLPDIDGLEVFRRIKADPELANTFVVILSGTRTAPDNQAEVWGTRTDEYITRPIANLELVARIQAMVRLKRAEDALRESEQRLTWLVQTAPVGIVVHAGDGRVIQSNPTAQKRIMLSAPSGRTRTTWFGP